MFKSRDSIVFWTAMAIAVFELLPAGLVSIPEVTAAPSRTQTALPDMAGRPWLDLQARESMTMTQAYPREGSVHRYHR